MVPIYQGNITREQRENKEESNCENFSGEISKGHATPVCTVARIKLFC